MLWLACPACKGPVVGDCLISGGRRRWEAILLVLDSKPFEGLTAIVQGLNDSRIWTFAEWIGVDFNPRKGSVWAPGYHHLLYNLTDEAIRACPPSTEWVIVTNGDNDYADTLLSTLRDSPKGSDIIALDYYSRYQRPTAAPCHRFQQEANKPHCKSNRCLCLASQALPMKLAADCAGLAAAC